MQATQIRSMTPSLEGAQPVDAALVKGPLDNAELKSRVLALAAPADQALRETLHSHVEYIEKVSDYIIFSGGKRLRPVLFLLAAAAVGKVADPKYATIFEYLHAATLLHDDVIDEAGLRRGRPAARKVYGNEAVILVGDFLFSKSYSLAAELPDHRFINALTDCTTHMAEGQVLELLRTDDLALSPQGYLEVIVAKTAVLLAAACQMGAIYGGADDAVIDALYRYGLNLGIAFQLVDDALDYVGTQHEFGKPVGHDLAEGKITLPLIHVRDTAEAGVRQQLMSLVGRSRTEPEAVEQAKQIIRDDGGVEYTFGQAARYSLEAQRALEPLAAKAGGAEMDTLMSIPSYVLTRRN